EQLAGTDETLDHYAANGSDDGDLRSHLRRIFRYGFGIFKAEGAQGVFAGLHIGLRLGVGRLGLLKVGFGDGAVSVEVLRAVEDFLREEKSIAGFDVGGTRSGI